jgi:hypothetical protein
MSTSAGRGRHVPARVRTEMFSRRAREAADLEAANARLAASETSAERLRRRLSESQAEVRRLRQRSAVSAKRVAFLEGSCETRARQCEEMAAELSQAQASLHASAAQQRRLQGEDDAFSAAADTSMASGPAPGQGRLGLALKVRRLEESLAAKEGLLRARTDENAALKAEINLMADAVDIREGADGGGEGVEERGGDGPGGLHLQCAKLKAQVRSLALDAAGKTAELKGLRSAPLPRPQTSPPLTPAPAPHCR